MPLRLERNHPGFDAAFARLVGAQRETQADVRAGVAEIVAQVRAEGDAALLRLTERFDRLTLTRVAGKVSALKARYRA